ncbi:prolipoprotein diacylglyceryl transferase [Dehalococcoidia bacterium]|nr:prolipoprotein diacylglyceryl transferase [Dehalococcoidia bacterium]
MLDSVPPQAITIGMNPSIVSAGPFHLTWHGFFTFLGILVVVLIAARRARGYGISEEIVSNVAMTAVVGGIIGARLFHVLDWWSYYIANPLQMLNLLSGGIALTGGIIGATVGAAIYIKFAKVPLGTILDIAAPGAPIGQMVGRIGDVINGEHFAVSTDLPWAFVYSHPGSPSFGLLPQHPAVAYEMIWDIFIAGILFWLVGKVRPTGMIFVFYIALYSIGRFFIQFLRLDAVYFAGLQEAHLLTLCLLVITVPLLIIRARPSAAGEDPYAEDRQ